MVADIQAKANNTISRGDILSMTRSIDLKLTIENKVMKRNKAYQELQQKRVEVVKRYNK